jgi:hypothetical protein
LPNPITVSFLDAYWSDLNCVYQVTYNASYLKGGSVIAAPFIVLNGATKTFSISPTLGSEVGLYSIILTASIPNPSAGAAAIKTASTSFKLIVNDNCGSTTLIDKTFNDMTVNVEQVTTQDITFQD